MLLPKGVKYKNEFLAQSIMLEQALQFFVVFCVVVEALSLSNEIRAGSTCSASERCATCAMSNIAQTLRGPDVNRSASRRLAASSARLDLFAPAISLRIGNVKVNFFSGPKPPGTYQDPTTELREDNEEFGSSRRARRFGM